MVFDFRQQEERIKKVLNTFDPITLARLDEVKMLNRIDAKYVFHINQFAEILEEIKENYYALEIEGRSMPIPWIRSCRGFYWTNRLARRSSCPVCRGTWN